MASVDLIAATTASATKVPVDVQNYDSVIFTAAGLAGAETATIFIQSAGSWVSAVNALGAAASLTATLPMLVLPGGGRYAVDKAATASPASVSVILKSAQAVG